MPRTGATGMTPPLPLHPLPPLARSQAKRALQCDETHAGWHGRELGRGSRGGVWLRGCSGAGLSRLMRWPRFFSRHPRPCGEDPDSRSLPLATGSLDPRDKPEGDGESGSGHRLSLPVRGGWSRQRPGGGGPAGSHRPEAGQVVDGSPGRPHPASPAAQPPSPKWGGRGGFRPFSTGPTLSK